jgi:hypothetical protein
MPYIGLAGRSVSVAVGSGVGPDALVVGVALAVGRAEGAVSVAVAVAVGAVAVGVVVSTGCTSVVTTEVGVVVVGADSLQPARATAAATSGAKLLKFRSAPQNGQRASALRT